MQQNLTTLVADPCRAQELLEGSLHYGGTFATWTQARQFIAMAFHRSGTVLDIGCANGFLLRCLQEWSQHALIPYGIDNDLSRVSQAAELFPSQSNHFVQLALENVHLLKQYGLPQTYDFVYWNVGDNTQFDTPDEIGRVELAFRAVSKAGRLILGFYDELTELREAKIRRLRTLGFENSGRISNHTLTREAVWIDHV